MQNDNRSSYSNLLMYRILRFLEKNSHMFWLLPYLGTAAQSCLRGCLMGLSPQYVHLMKHNSQLLGCAFFFFSVHNIKAMLIQAAPGQWISMIGVLRQAFFQRVTGTCWWAILMQVHLPQTLACLKFSWHLAVDWDSFHPILSSFTIFFHRSLHQDLEVLPSFFCPLLTESLTDWIPPWHLLLRRPKQKH